jgi:hypothetical protein
VPVAAPRGAAHGDELLELCHELITETVDLGEGLRLVRQ